MLEGPVLHHQHDNVLNILQGRRIDGAGQRQQRNELGLDRHGVDEDLLEADDRQLAVREGNPGTSRIYLSASSTMP